MNRAASQIIYTHGGGRLGNQVIRFVHWIAAARAGGDGFEVLNFAFWPFAPYFEVWRKHPACVYPLRKARVDTIARWYAALPSGLRQLLETRRALPRLVQAAGRVLPGWQAIGLNIAQDESLDLDLPEFRARVSRRSVTTCCGWRIATWAGVATQEAELRPYFRPAPEVRQVSDDFMARLRTRYDVLIGVLIRQSDYRQWNDGRFHFEASSYACWMRQLLDLHPGKRVGFVVASEVRQEPALFADLPYHPASGMPGEGGHWFESWVELSRCDLVVSPPSTFSATAAFVGGIPLWPVLVANQEMAFGQMISGGLAGAARHPGFSFAVK